MNAENKTDKLCTCCLVVKPTSEFGIRRKSADGLKFWCKQCCKDSNDERYAYNGAYIRAKNREYKSKKSGKKNVYLLSKKSPIESILQKIHAEPQK